MPWQAGAANLGFTAGKPWLPLAPEHAALAADVQEADARSTLAFTRQAIAARRAAPALRWGDIAFLEAPEPILAFERRFEGELATCLFNLSPEPQTLAGWNPPGEVVLGEGPVEASLSGLALGPYAFRVFRG
jgi:alpha-glucosidase